MTAFARHAGAILCGCAAAILGGASSQAITVSINLHQTTAADQENYTVDAADAAGIVPATNWNNIGFEFGNLADATTGAISVNDSSGAAAATFTSSLGTAYVGNNFAVTGILAPKSPNRDFMHSYLSFDGADGDGPEDVGNLTISGLGSAFTNTGYNVIVYSDADQINRRFLITVGGTTKSIDDGGTFDGLFVEGNDVEFSPATGSQENYVVFSGLTSSTFTLDMFSSPGRGAVNAIQITTDPVPVPHPVLQIDRTTGTIDLVNMTESPVAIKGYSITSAVGALDQSAWQTVSDNYDQSGDESIDANEEWFVLSDPGSTTDFSEASINGGNLNNPGTLRLGEAGAWIGNPSEDLQIELLLADGSLLPTIVSFVGNDGAAIDAADLNADGTVDAADWLVLRGNLNSGMLSPTSSVAQLFQAGDSDSDFDVDRLDFLAFKDAYIAANGAAAFAALSQPVPEPATWLTMLLGGALLMVACRSNLWVTPRARLNIRKNAMSLPNPLTMIAAVAAVVATTLSAVAQDEVVFSSAFDANTGAFIFSGNTDNTNGSSTLNINDWSTAASVSSISGLTAISTGDSGTLGGFAQTQNGAGAYANPDVVYLSRNHNVDSDRTTSKRGYSFDFSLSSGWDLTTLTVASGHTNNTGQQDQSFTSDLIFELSGGSLASPVTGTAAEDYGVAPAYHSVEFDVSAVSLGAGNYTVSVYQTNMPGGGAYATYDGITLEGFLDDGLPNQLELVVDSTTGAVRLQNNTGAPVAIDYYEIRSPEGDLVVGSAAPGDYNSDGTTNLADYTVWRDNLGSNGPAGDGTGDDMSGTPDGDVDQFDYEYWKANFGATSGDGGWFSLQDQDVDGSGPAGDGLGWEEGDSVSSSILFEAVLAENGFEMPVDADYSLGNAFSPGGAANLIFEYHLVGGGANFVQGGVNYTASGSLDTSAVPEPHAGVLMMLASGVVLLFKRAKSSRFSIIASVLLVSGIVAWAFAGSDAQAAVTNDRFYQLGDDSLENPNSGVEMGTNNSAPLPSGDTADTIGNGTGTYADLDVFGPTYQNVGAIGVGRSGWGARFDGVDDRLQGVSLNFPETSNTPDNYTGILGHGSQGWVYPEKLTGSYQQIMYDTILTGGVAINSAGQWTQTNSQHGNGDDGIAPVPATVSVPAANTWYHYMHQNYPSSDEGTPTVVPGTGTIRNTYSVVYIDGIAVSANNDTIVDFSASGITTSSNSLVIGASEIPDATPPVYGNFFQGVIDDVEMYVYGDNSSQGGQDYGTFDLFSDNEWIASQIAAGPLNGTLLAGDVNRDGVVNGNGLGPASSDDVSAFVDGWLREKVLQGTHNSVRVGDWETWGWGDFDHDGRVSLTDWELLSRNHPNSENLSLGALLAASNVPEPSSILTIGLLTTCGLIVGYRTRR
ncbi:hypothetical protein [Aeoliella mucimassa]|uniref:PEP-CTERM motif protein n=1 Tax=Aeoliella mucimassa TaxID=2527972 RepID=A0A518AQK2_9BACT|nr:hypothetical protein [Aeoliella mucimassa]QDU56996.1 PEP-CTERM motif protein [Aeoliella mucimassa]